MRFFSLFLFLTLLAVDSSWADESLASCSKQKHKQIALADKSRHAAPSRARKKKNSGQTSTMNARQKIEQIDEWLWKNCRSYAAEMRTIEQQNM